MNSPLLTAFLFFTLQLSAQDTVYKRSYDFGSLNSLKGQYEVVLIVKQPQTETALEIKGRIFSDSSDIAFLQCEFYETSVSVSYSDGVHTESESTYFCGHDLYFFLRKDGELQLLTAKNSDCEITKSNLQFLSEHGKKLTTDTIKTYFPKNIGTKKKFQDLFKNAIYSDYDSPGLFYSRNTKSITHIPHYFDGSFILSVSFDSLKSIEEHIEKRLAELGIDPKSKALNWSFTDKSNQEYSWWLSENQPIPLKLEFDVWFTKELSEKFKDLPGFITYKNPEKRYTLDKPIVIWREE